MLVDAKANIHERRKLLSMLWAFHNALQIAASIAAQNKLDIDVFLRGEVLLSTGSISRQHGVQPLYISSLGVSSVSKQLSGINRHTRCVLFS